jgi:cell shape-determining protein MreC
MSRRNKIILSVLALVALGAGLLQTPLLATVRRAVWSGLVAGAGRWWEVGPLAYDAASVDQLSALRAENIRLKGELQDYAQLRQQLRQPAVESLRSIPALVSGAPLDVFRTHVLLNQGALDGVVLGAPVVVDGSTLVGFISDISEHAAVCRLLFDPGTSIPAEVVGLPNARGLVTGQLHTSLMLGTVPRDAAVEVDHSVVTVANGAIPAGLVIGAVERVYNEENEAYQQARLKVLYDTDNLRAVTILVQP